MARVDEEGDGRARHDLSPARPGASQAIRASQIRPSLLAAYTASARRRAPSFCMTLPTWNFTVAAEMYRRCPIATLLSPRASRTRISRSRGVMSLAAAPGPLAAVHPADDDPGAAGVEGALPPVHGPDRPDQLGQVHVLDHEALRALLDGLQDQPLIRGTRQHEHPDVGVALGYRGAQGQAVALAAGGQPQIEEHHPGTGPVEHRRGQPGGRRLADHPQIRFPVDHGPQALPDDRVIVDDGDPDLIHGSLLVGNRGPGPAGTPGWQSRPGRTGQPAGSSPSLRPARRCRSGPGGSRGPCRGPHHG